MKKSFQKFNNVNNLGTSPNFFVKKSMIEKIIGCALEGIESHKVEVEVNISRGAKFSLVGLPDNAVKESHFRIVAALIPVKEIIINSILKRKVLTTCLLP